MDVIHTAVWVSDLAAARSFFVDRLGLEENRAFTTNGVENVFVGGEEGEIQLRHAPDHAVPAPDRERLDHVAVSVDDVDAKSEQLVGEGGGELLDGPRTVDVVDARISFVEGPDGYVVELVEDVS